MTNISELESLIVETAVRKAREKAEAELLKIEQQLATLLTNPKNYFGTMDSATKVKWEYIRLAVIASVENAAEVTAIQDFVKKYNEAEPQTDQSYKMRKGDPLGQNPEPSDELQRWKQDEHKCPYPPHMPPSRPTQQWPDSPAWPGRRRLYL